MSSILLIETATTICSVALAKDGNVLAFKEVNQRNIHAEVITLFIDDILRETEQTYNQLDAIAVSSGPGSYTGLRIGVSTAKGLCFALEKPLIAVETLAGMANGVITQNKYKRDILLCPMIDARRMEVYAGIFNAGGNQLKPTWAEIIDENSFLDFLDQHQVLFFGDGAAKCREVLGVHPNALFDVEFASSARFINELAAVRYNQNQFEDVAYFEPYYLKDFIAGKKKVD